MEESRSCTRCGALATPENAFCGKCGAPLGPGAASAASFPLAAPVPVTAGSASKRSTSRGKFLGAILAVIVVIATLAAVGYYAVGSGGAKPSPTPTLSPTPSPTPITHTVTGTLVLSGGGAGNFLTYPGSVCAGVRGYSDLGHGASVVLLDESGTILASTTLDQGTVLGTTRCSFSFTLTGVTDTAKFYAVQVSHRGQVTQSHDEMVTLGWVFALTIG